MRNPIVRQGGIEIETLLVSQLMATIRQLDEQRRMHEQEGDYQEAAKVARRLQELKVSRPEFQTPWNMLSGRTR